MIHGCGVKFFWCFDCAYSSCTVKKFCKQQKTNVTMLKFLVEALKNVMFVLL